MQPQPAPKRPRWQTYLLFAFSFFAAPVVLGPFLGSIVSLVVLLLMICFYITNVITDISKPRQPRERQQPYLPPDDIRHG